MHANTPNIRRCKVKGTCVTSVFTYVSVCCLTECFSESSTDQRDTADHSDTRFNILFSQLVLLSFPPPPLNELVLGELTRGTTGPRQRRNCISAAPRSAFLNLAALQTAFPRVQRSLSLLHPLSMNHRYLLRQQGSRGPPKCHDLTVLQSVPIKLEVGWGRRTLPLRLLWELASRCFKISPRSGQLNTNKTIIYEARVLIDSSLKALSISPLPSKCASFVGAIHFLPPCLFA